MFLLYPEGNRMRAEIIAVGTELLMGQIANTNAQFYLKAWPTWASAYIFIRSSVTMPDGSRNRLRLRRAGPT